MPKVAGSVSSWVRFEISSIVRTTSSATQSPEKISVSLFGSSYETPVGKDDLHSKDLVYGESILAGQGRVATS